MPDFIVASTTATQEEVDHAVSENWRERVPNPEVKPEVKPEPTETVEPETPATAQETEQVETESAPEAETTQEKPKSKGGFQKKIDKLTRERGEEKDRADRLEQQLSEFRAKFDAIEQRLAPKAETPQEKPKTEIAGKPLESEIGTKYKDWTEYNEALIDWTAEQKIQARLAERDQSAQEREAKEIEESRDAGYKEAATKFQEEVPDFNEAVNAAAKAGMKLPVPIIELIKELPNGPAVTNYLVRNLDEALALVQMSPAMGFAAIGRISQGLESEAKPKAVTPAKKVVSTAPPAHKPVTGASARGTLTLEDLSKQGTDDYIRARKTQIAQRDKARYS
ncbi:MAG TPA: hypothetical protein VN950_22950 [Terriglobales bacterium]|nr:hypothetical protein [Terriglobales bacterium]